MRHLNEPQFLVNFWKTERRFYHHGHPKYYFGKGFYWAKTQEDCKIVVKSKLDKFLVDLTKRNYKFDYISE